GWLASAYLLFRHLHLTVRERSVGWVVVVAFVAYSIARRFSSYYIFHSAWSLWLASDAVALLFVAVCVGVVVIILPKASTRWPTQYSVESEAPDHVIHVGGT